MALYALGDLHLSFQVHKPMTPFGRVWKNHERKIEKYVNRIVKPEDTLVLCGIVASAIVAVNAKKVIDSVIALAATGSFVALEFVLLQAPDVAIAEASVGAVLSTILYIIALRKVYGRKGEQQ